MATAADFERAELTPHILNFALDSFPDTVPDQRTSGIADIDGERGNGDYLTCVMAEGTARYVTREKGRQVQVVRTCGRGDLGADLLVWDGATDRPYSINLKGSNHEPGEDLHLYVKNEEFAKPESEQPDIYAQVFIRAGALNFETPRLLRLDLKIEYVPAERRFRDMMHLVLAGWCFRGDKIPPHLVSRLPSTRPWTLREDNITIPKTGGHLGTQIEVRHLWPMNCLYEILASHRANFRAA